MARDGSSISNFSLSVLSGDGRVVVGLVVGGTEGATCLARSGNVYRPFPGPINARTWLLRKVRPLLILFVRVGCCYEALASCS
ncbi:hypothetical protein F2Q69_00038308 [Brassica cretica]|uniref:Uncharacterized protein n=1 Tax=Brassica cretica TaxID=69181 RepID=A0A8S9STP5_BRACR|nr:hypothetical protein F2Q69_00038308 [Brassica cretica]